MKIMLLIVCAFFVSTSWTQKEINTYALYLDGVQLNFHHDNFYEGTLDVQCDVWKHADTLFVTMKKWYEVKSRHGFSIQIFNEDFRM